jgi:predicted ATPase
MPAPDSVEAEGQKSPALDSLEVEGYKSIRAAEIHLGPINVLIGANGSGKSNLVGVFGLLADLADHRLQLHVARQGGADALLHFGAKKSPAMGFSLRFGLHGYEASLIHAVGDTLMFEYEVTLQWVARKANQDPLSGDPIPMYLGRSGHKETELCFNPMDSRQDLIGATGPEDRRQSKVAI